MYCSSGQIHILWDPTTMATRSFVLSAVTLLIWSATFSLLTVKAQTDVKNTTGAGMAFLLKPEYLRQLLDEYRQLLSGYHTDPYTIGF